MYDLFIVRHAEPQGSDRLLGHSAADLSAEGVGQARRLAARLATLGVERIITSDLVRARRTAELIAQAAHAQIAASPLLRERGFGDWEGLTPEDVKRLYPEQYERWRRDPSTLIGCGVEAYPHLIARAIQFVSGVEPGRLVIVSHRGMIRLLLERFVGVPWGCFRRLEIGYASVTHLSGRELGKLELDVANDRCHLGSL